MRAAAAVVLFGALSAAVPALGSSGSDEEKWVPDGCGQRARWTVLYYSNADNNLQGAMIDDLEEIATVGSSSLALGSERSPTPLDRHIVMLLDTRETFADDKTFSIRVERFQTPASPEQEASPGAYGPLQLLSEKNMADGATLSQFLTAAMRCYPADRTALIINGHGTGARAGDGTSTDLRSRAFGRDLHPRPPRPPLSGTAPPVDVLYVSEAAGAIRAALDAVGRKTLDLIGLDACLMSTVEVAYAFHTVTPLLVASSNIEAPQGWKHDLWLSKLAGNPQAPPLEVAGWITSTYADAIEHIQGRNEQRELLESRTLAATQLEPPEAPAGAVPDSCLNADVKGLREKLDALGAVIQNDTTRALTNWLLDARCRCRDFGPDTSAMHSADLACVMSLFKQNIEVDSAPNAASPYAGSRYPAALGYANDTLGALGCMVKHQSIGRKIIGGRARAKDASGIGGCDERGQTSTASAGYGLSLFLPLNYERGVDSVIFQGLGDSATPMPFFRDAPQWTDFVRARR